LFKGVLINYYEQHNPIKRQIFLQILIYLSSTRKGLILTELEELLVSIDQFDRKDAKDVIEEFVEVFDFSYTYDPESNILLPQNFMFNQSVSCLIEYVNQ